MSLSTESSSTEKLVLLGGIEPNRTFSKLEMLLVSTCCIKCIIYRIYYSCSRMVVS